MSMRQRSAASAVPEGLGGPVVGPEQEAALAAAAGDQVGPARHDGSRVAHDRYRREHGGCCVLGRASRIATGELVAARAELGAAGIAVVVVDEIHATHSPQLPRVEGGEAAQADPNHSFLRSSVLSFLM
jgi:hypothetical protein